MVDQMVQEDRITSLIAAYMRANEATKDEGRAWYSDAREAVRTIAFEMDQDTSTVAAVVAALSPMTEWGRNMAGAMRLVRAFRNGEEEAPRNCTTFYKNAVKAWRILQNGNPYEEFEKSPKVYAFWRNLCGDEQAITIDTWMLRVVGEDKAAGRGAKEKLVRVCTEAVRAAAYSVAETPAQFQAIVWCQVRKEGIR